MRAGTLRERVTIQRQSATTTQEWGSSNGWADLVTVSASVIAQAAAESVVAQGVAGQTRYTVRIRYRSDLTTRDRISWKGKTLDLLGIVNVNGRNRELEITAVEHAATT